jgi:Rrf2 family protein
MKLSTKGEYGLLAVIDLALHSGRGPVQSFQIAERQSIPKQYLDQLLLVLKKSGLIESSRGRQGGYQLARPAREITLFDIVTALEGPIENVNFLGKTPKNRTAIQALLKDIWSDLISHTAEILRKRTLEEFCDRHRSMQEQPMYYI